MVAVLFIVFLVALAIGVPVAFSLGLASVAYMLGSHIQMINFAQYFFKGLDSFTLLCIPGFTFAGYNAHELYVACCNAQDAYNNKENWKNLVRHCMECDFSWDVSAKSYEGLYNETANLW